MTLRLAAITTAAVCLISAAAFRAPAPVVPDAEMELLASGHPVTNLTVDGRGPYRFIIDTAATKTALLAGFRKAHGPLVEGAGMSVAGASGAAEIRLTTLGRLDVAGRMFESLEVYNLPDGPVDALGVHGVLGADVLMGFAVEMEPRTGRWRLDARHTSEPDLSYVPFTLDEGDAPVMTVSVQGQRLAALVDTGAQGTIMNQAAAAALGLSPEDGSARVERSARGTGSGATAAWSACLTGFSYDGREPEPVRMLVADLPVFAALGLADSPAIILGYDHLGRGRIVIDYPESRIGFARKSAASPC
ncbi:MAG: hypothetical protein EON88_00095 [Brevundimonas sp.]|nr:MAG: hypothetical protein EON88_00095 [Brevundimonas sp.]